MKASVLIVDDDEALRRALSDRIRYWGHGATVAEDGEGALALAGKETFDLVFLDMNMPGLSGLDVLERLRESGVTADIVVLTAYGSTETAVEAIKRGADDFLSKPADFTLLRNVVERSLEKRRLKRVNRALEDRSSPMVPGDAPAMRELLATADRAAPANTTLLITGESGTGKQVLAEYVHAQSERAGGPFIYVNCVAISEDLIESTLFGHEKGAFTGAVQRKEGRLEAAGGGTAFLDEIGDISSGLQTKLLHFLETGEFERVGGTQTHKVDCRVIAATNKDLETEVREGRFREDLYYRLNVITLPIPPLRERAGDIPTLADAFLQCTATELGRPGLAFAEETLDFMRKYPWPGNVRQLRNAVERMAVLAPGEELTRDLLPPEILRGPDTEDSDLLHLPYKEAVTEFKRRMLAAALRRSDGNQTKAAETLELQRSYLNRLLKELDVDYGSD